MYGQAIQWALTQKDEMGNQITSKDGQLLVDKVREYFNNNDIEYDTFSYVDLIPYLPEQSNIVELLGGGFFTPFRDWG